jgi:hypothetical protein
VTVPVNAVREATAELHKVGESLTKLLDRWRMYLALVVAGLLVIGYAVVVVIGTVVCVVEWAEDSAARAQALDRPTRERDAALDELLIDVFTAGTDRATLIADGKRVKATSAARLDVARAHPVPESPLLHCNIWTGNLT